MLLNDLFEMNKMAQRWSAMICPTKLPRDIKIDRLPRPSYEGDNPYNGFTGSERRRADQVIQILRRRGIIEKAKECELCGAADRIGFHAENYFDPCALVRMCFPCHMALHRRFKSASKWLTKLDQGADRPRINDFRALPMQEIDFATWLRTHTPGPHDVVEAVWPGKVVQDYKPRAKGV